MTSRYAEHQEKISKIYDSPSFPPIHQNQKLIEFGCGVGALSRSVALTYPEVEITAVDISQVLIDIGMAKAQKQGITNVTFLKADARSLKDLSGNYDGAYCRFLLEEFTDPEDVIASMAALVKEGGWVCAYERLNSSCCVCPHSEAISQIWKAIYEFYHRSYGASPYVADNLSLHFLKAGLKDIRTQGCSKVLSLENDKDRYFWYIEAALSVISQVEGKLLANDLITEATLKSAQEDYQRLRDSVNSFILEVTVCVFGIK